MIGDLDPIKAVRGNLELGDEMTMHYGLLPRANRGIFAINELPDLAGKIQVWPLFNILQEGDVQIKGYPVRLPLDVVMVFSANPEDYTARGKIITPLKDRIGSEIHTHYPKSRHDAIDITSQEAWTARAEPGDPLAVDVPAFVREIVEEIAFQARVDARVDKRSGVSQRLAISCLENVVSNAERRSLASMDTHVVPRATDVYASLPSLTGKIELEYEGELKGADVVGRDLVRAAVATVFNGYTAQVDFTPVISWFENGGTLPLSDETTSSDLLSTVKPIDGFEAAMTAIGVRAGDGDGRRAAAADFILEGLAALKKISRTEEGRLHAPAPPVAKPRERAKEIMMDEPTPRDGGKKRYN